MPLSDREQQLLEQMERALIEEDPKFATSMRGGPGQARNRRRVAIGIGGVLVGLAVILLGVTIQQVVVGALGFAVMVSAVVYAMTEKSAAKGKANLQVVPDQGGASKAPKPSHKKGSTSSFMQRMEERWDKRRDEGRF